MRYLKTYENKKKKEQNSLTLATVKFELILNEDFWDSLNEDILRIVDDENENEIEGMPLIVLTNDEKGVNFVEMLIEKCGVNLKFEKTIYSTEIVSTEKERFGDMNYDFEDLEEIYPKWYKKWYPVEWEASKYNM